MNGLINRKFLLLGSVIISAQLLAVEAIIPKPREEIRPGGKPHDQVPGGDRKGFDEVRSREGTTRIAPRGVTPVNVREGAPKVGADPLVVRETLTRVESEVLEPAGRTNPEAAANIKDQLESLSALGLSPDDQLIAINRVEELLRGGRIDDASNYLAGQRKVTAAEVGKAVDLVLANKGADTLKNTYISKASAAEVKAHLNAISKEIFNGKTLEQLTAHQLSSLSLYAKDRVESKGDLSKTQAIVDSFGELVAKGDGTNYHDDTASTEWMKITHEGAVQVRGADGVTSPAEIKASVALVDAQIKGSDIKGPAAEVLKAVKAKIGKGDFNLTIHEQGTLEILAGLANDLRLEKKDLPTVKDIIEHCVK